MMGRHRVNRWGISGVRDTAVLLSSAGALFFPAPALAQSALPNVLGDYRGFAQSIDPSIPPVMVVLTLDRQDELGDFSWSVFLLPFIEQDDLYEGFGKVDPKGSLKLLGTDSAGNEVKATGTFEGLAHQGALLLLSYKFTRATGGPVDHGVIHLLRSFQLPDPCTPPDCPPDITARWSGPLTSDLSGRRVEIVLDVTRQTGTSFEGFETVAGIQPCSIIGTIGNGNFVYIAFGPGRRALVAGQQVSQPPQDDGLDARFFRTVVTGAETGPVDLGRFTVRRLAR